MISNLLQAVLGEWAPLLTQEGIRLVPPISAIQLSGGRTKDRKANFLVFSHNQDSPALILKIGRTPEYDVQLRREFQALNTVWELGALQSSLPQPVGLVSLENNLVMIERCLPGISLGVSLHRRQRATEAQVREDFRQSFEWLQALQSATASGDENFQAREKVERRLARCHMIAENLLPEGFVQSILEASDSIQGTQMPQVSSHGDFWPGNIMVDDGAFGVIDWEDFRPSAHPFYDFFQYIILYAQIFPWHNDWRDIPHSTTFNNAVLDMNWYSGMVLEYLHDLMKVYRIPTEYAHFLFSLYLLDRAAPTPQEGIKRQQQAGKWQDRLGWYTDNWQNSIFLGRG